MLKKVGNLMKRSATASLMPSEGSSGTDAALSPELLKLENELTRLAEAIGAEEAKIKKIEAAIEAWEEDPDAAFAALPEHLQKRYKDTDRYFEKLEKQVKKLEKEKNFLQKEKTAVRQEKTAVRRKENLLQEEKTAREQKEAAQQQEKTAVQQEKTAREQAKVADVQPRSLWDRLDQQGTQYNDAAQRSAKSFSTQPTSTEGWPGPEKVYNWVKFDDLIKQPSSDKPTEVAFTLSIGDDFDLNWNEASIVSRVIAPYLELVRKYGIKTLVDVAISYFFEVNVQDGLIPDGTFFYSSIETPLFPVEAKAPGKYAPTTPNDMAAHWYDSEVPDRSPITQVYIYSCAMQSRYCVLTTGRYTWFMEREEGVLNVSRAFQPSDLTPSLAQAWVTFVGLANSNPTSKVEETAKGFPTKFKRDREAAREEAAEKRAERALKRARTTSSLSQMDSDEEIADLTQLPLEELSCDFSPIESYGPLTHGVAHRNLIHGLDSVIKIVDANKDVEGAEGLEYEASMYEELRDLWGSAIPNLVYAGPLTLGRSSLAITYEGQSLDRKQLELGMSKDELKRKACDALEALHQRGVVHGDVALRNIVVDPATKSVKLIDLGASSKVDPGASGQAELAKESRALSALLDESLDENVAA
mmetsp:Transcript_18838/g.33447  ORF Transcript_18838/g.33447 Transcript_18838/m.33447 type:complete len:641 (+) Transcript_18838:295-2217(+)